MSSSLADLFGDKKNSGGLFSALIGIGLIVTGVVYLNAQFSFLNFSVDLQDPTLQIIIGFLALIGGIIMCIHALKG